MPRLLILFSIIVLTVKLESIKIKALYEKDSNIIIYNGNIYYSKIENNLLYENKIAFIEEIPQENNNYWFYITIIALLVSMAGIMSGLTVGYLSIDELILELKSHSGTEKEKYYASKIRPVISNRHWLLVTLLISNAFAMEALPIFLDKITSEIMAIVISVTLVLFFGEIIPQSLCTGPNQLQIAAFLAPLTKGFMWFTYPASYPIAMLLDYLVGKHSRSRFENSDLKGLIELHTMEALKKISNEIHDDKIGGLENEQANLMISALECQTKVASEMMIPKSKTIMIDYNEPLDLEYLISKGLSRIPVFDSERDNVVGILRMKQLIGLDLSKNKSLKSLGVKLKMPIIVHPNTDTLQLLREFKKGKSHMAFVSDHVEDFQKKLGLNEANSYVGPSLYTKKKKTKLLGIITFEDVIEKMINMEILDEDDYDLKKKRPPKKISSLDPNEIKIKFSQDIAMSILRDKNYHFNINDFSLGKESKLKEEYDVEFEEEENSLKLKEPLINI